MTSIRAFLETIRARREDKRCLHPNAEHKYFDLCNLFDDANGPIVRLTSCPDCGANLLS